jgi:hypothetical protein
MGIGLEIGSRQVTHGIACVTGLTPGQILPRPSRVPIVGSVNASSGQKQKLTPHCLHTAVAVVTIHSTGFHGAPLALGDFSRVALITGVIHGGILGKYGRPAIMEQVPMIFMHDIGERGMAGLVS